MKGNPYRKMFVPTIDDLSDSWDWQSRVPVWVQQSENATKKTTSMTANAELVHWCIIRDARCRLVGLSENDVVCQNTAQMACTAVPICRQTAEMHVPCQGTSLQPQQCPSAEPAYQSPCLMCASPSVKLTCLSQRGHC
jgi:hypothetical protein